jgi:deoxyhypusine synthase
MESKENQEFVEKVLESVPSSLTDAVNKDSNVDFVKNSTPVKGYDFNKGIDYDLLFQSYKSTGIQATAVGEAIDIINGMINWRLSDEEIDSDEEEDFKDPETRKNTRCTIFMGYTSNMISCGMRETIRYLCQHKMIDCIVTTTGGIEEDFIKCFNDFFIGDFNISGAKLREIGVNRIGNMLAPNKCYTDFEKFFIPLIGEMHKEQKEKGTIFSPSMIINRMGKAINNEESVYYWCWKNDIPVFCPSITDGALGDNLFFYNYNDPGFIVDVVQDIVKINKFAMEAKHTGMLICGGGVIKHHICNANMMRDGADLSVYINTAQEFDCSDAGANPDEAISWGKIKATSKNVKVYSEFSIVLPIIVSQTFAKHHDKASKVGSKF